MLDPVGFWSYARQDDAHSDGQLSLLRAIVGKQIVLQCGVEVTLWQDIAAIPYGADWAETIERTIGQTTFFIPIVTPRFLKSENCRDEFVSFRRRMQRLGRNDLVFPVHYISVDDVRPDETVFGDDLAALRRSQWIDFRPLFYADPKSQEVRRWAGELAADVLKALRRPMATRTAPEGAHSGDGRTVIAPERVEETPPAAPAVETPPATPSPAPDRPTPSVAPASPEEAAASPTAATPAQAPQEAVSPGSGDARSPLAGPEPDDLSRKRRLIAGVVALVVVVAASVGVVATRGRYGLTPSPSPSSTSSASPASTSAPSPVALGAPTVSPSPIAGQTIGATEWGHCPWVSLAPLASRPPSVLSAAEECGLKPKDQFRECANCPVMVVVPAGSFTMGSPASEKGRSDDEGPQHDARIGKPFAAAAFTVTFDEWDACVADGGCGGYKPSDQGWGRGRRPVINVSWNDAQLYVKWLSSKTGEPYRHGSELRLTTILP
ncbi:MAG: SUMF1/EgtB/PvdO family nonheme iron enzyme [Roseiarcus sp.]|jgi:hypothetical protein